jgi:osmotically-inducible protein OsmY
MKGNEQLRQDVIDELAWDPSITSSDIQVSASDGIVTIRGEVGSYAERWAAGRDARRVAGVKDLNNNLVVELDASRRRSDEEIARAARDVLAANGSIPFDRVQVSAVDGWVTLGGEVPWTYQQTVAEDAVRYLAGVRGITNRIKVQPPQPIPADIRERIERAFWRNAELDAGAIQVTAHDGTVTLEGTVRSWAERDEAARAAGAAPGVRNVHNQLVVML